LRQGLLGFAESICYEECSSKVVPYISYSNWIFNDSYKRLQEL